MKKTILILCAVLFCFSCVMFQGCSTNNYPGSDDAGNNVSIGGKKNVLKASDLSIEDYEWETSRTKYNGVDCYSFSLKNNSDYDIIAVEFTYKVKDNVSDSDLVVYDEFMKDHDGYIEEDDSPKDVILRGSKNTLVAKGEQLTGLRFTVGFQNWSWYDYPTDEQFNLMEPKEMQIGVIGKDNILYIAYYDFEDNTWILDENTKAVDTWSEKEIATKIGKPEEGHHIVTTDDEDELDVYSYGIKVDEYNQYVESLKSSGFEEESNSSSHFEGKDANGYVVELWYYSDEERLSISIEKDS